MSGSKATLELIAKSLETKYGIAYAKRWLAEQQQAPKQQPVLVQQTVVAKALEAPVAMPETLSGPVRRFPELLPADLRISPVEARKTALRRLEAEAEITAARLREQVGFAKLVIRCDRRLRLVQFHTRLVLYGLMFAFERGYRKASTLTVHTVMELVGYCLGVKSSSTLYSYLHALKTLGLIDFKGHVTTISQQDTSGAKYQVNRCDGALLCIKLRGTKTAKLSRFDFDENPRDLQADIERGHTAYRLLRQFEVSQHQEDRKVDITTLVQWSLNPSSLFSPLKADSSGFAAVAEDAYPTSIFDLMASRERNQDVDVTAHSLARALGDQHSLDFYRKLCWQLLRAKDRGWDFSNHFYNAVVRVMADTRERFARKPGALLISRLKASNCWQELWRDQNQWVGEMVVR